MHKRCTPLGAHSPLACPPSLRSPHCTAVQTPNPPTLNPNACLLLPVLPCCDPFKTPTNHPSKPQQSKQDPEARKLNAVFIGDMKALERDIIAQHKAGDWTRCKPNKKGEPHAGTYSTCLIPGSGPGVTLRGVPYSVSI